MKKQLKILVPLALLLLFFILNLILGLSTPITGLQYEADGDYESITFHRDGTASLDNEVMGSYTVIDGKIHLGGSVLYKEAYSLKITYGSQTRSYICNAAIAFQVLLALGEAVCLAIIIGVVVYRVMNFVYGIRRLSLRIDLIEKKLNDKTNKGL